MVVGAVVAHDAMLVDAGDQYAVRNVNNVLTLCQMMINENKAEEGTARFLVPGYVQHNPLIADGSVALGKYFANSNGMF
jgi:predicted SnoaL-like aldol condensation-catalyzing enzyme